MSDRDYLPPGDDNTEGQAKQPDEVTPLLVRPTFLIFK